MKNKENVFNCLIIMLSELMYSPAHPGRNRTFRMSFRVFGKLIIKGLTTGNDILGLYCRL
jgi:hypothetical protein